MCFFVCSLVGPTPGRIGFMVAVLERTGLELIPLFVARSGMARTSTSIESMKRTLWTFHQLIQNIRLDVNSSGQLYLH
jgi:hypothetical protein